MTIELYYGTNVILISRTSVEKEISYFLNDEIRLKRSKQLAID